MARLGATILLSGFLGTLAVPASTANTSDRPPTVTTAAAAPAAPKQHHRVRWQLYLREHRVTTRLGQRVRVLRARLLELRTQLARARHVQAVAPASQPAPSDGVAYWRARQIAAAETIAHEAGADPWPNCADPVWNGAASWDVTVACENGGDWLDSPGYYRCGLQFDPMWETRFGRLCP